jgi:hypothetical protein
VTQGLSFGWTAAGAAGADAADADAADAAAAGAAGSQREQTLKIEYRQSGLLARRTTHNARRRRARRRVESGRAGKWRGLFDRLASADIDPYRSETTRGAPQWACFCFCRAIPTRRARRASLATQPAAHHTCVCMYVCISIHTRNIYAIWDEFDDLKTQTVTNCPTIAFPGLTPTDTHWHSLAAPHVGPAHGTAYTSMSHERASCRKGGRLIADSQAFSLLPSRPSSVIPIRNHSPAPTSEQPANVTFGRCIASASAETDCPGQSKCHLGIVCTKSFRVCFPSLGFHAALRLIIANLYPASLGIIPKMTSPATSRRKSQV